MKVDVVRRVVRIDYILQFLGARTLNRLDGSVRKCSLFYC